MEELVARNPASAPPFDGRDRRREAHEYQVGMVGVQGILHDWVNGVLRWKFGGAGGNIPEQIV
jgi:hypothetical protein